MMAVLPDEIWTQILETGARTARLTHRDLCCAAIACRRLNRLSGEPAIWSILLALDFPQQTLNPTPTPSPKSTYKIRFERDKARRLAAWRRTVLNAESQVVVCRNNVKELESKMMKESERLKAAVEEVNNLERARRASVALNVWQPEVIRGRQKQIVEQCTVPIESRLGAVKMEVRLCKQQIATYSKAYNDQMRKLSECKEALTSLKYQPLQSSGSSVTVDDCNVKQKKKRRREAASLITQAQSSLSQDLDITWWDGRGKFLNDGQLLTLSLDHYSGSGFQSKNMYLFGKIDMKIKLAPDNSAGIVTTFYLSSQGPNHDELDFEFLGNVTGQPYTIHTNIFTQGEGNREQQFYLWFDPTMGFHTYSILWNPQNIIIYVDGTPLRVFKNHEANNIPFPNKQTMRMYSSLWDAEDWATRGGLVKTDWTKAPFTASYQGYNAQACIWSSGASTCSSTASSRNPWFNQGLDSVSQGRLLWVQKNYMIYNYCKDVMRFPQGLPAECSLP